MTVYADTAAPAEATAVNIYQAIGGRAAVTAAVDGLYGRIIADPVLGRFFPQGVAAKHRAYVVTVLGEALGGPERYRGPSRRDPRLTGCSRPPGRPNRRDRGRAAAGTGDGLTARAHRVPVTGDG